MSDLHLEFPFKTPQGETVEGYEIFECTPSAPYLALLGDIGLCNDSGLFTFLGRQLKKYSKIFFVMGNHEGYHSSYVGIQPYATYLILIAFIPLDRGQNAAIELHSAHTKTTGEGVSAWGVYLSGQDAI